MGRGHPINLRKNMNPENPETPVDQATPVVVTPDSSDVTSTPSQPATPEKKFTKRERLEFSKAKIEQQLEELDNAEDDTRPLTVGDFKKMQQEKAKETALELATAIENQDERDEVIDILESRIVPSGNADEDLKLARDMVNARKNAQIAEEMARKQSPHAHASTPGAPVYTPEAFTPTAEELTFMQPPYSLSKEQIIAVRNKEKQ